MRYRLVLAGLLPALLAGCSDDDAAADTADVGDTPGELDVGPDADGDADGDADDGADESGEAVIPDEHPRIYLNAANRARLDAALAAGSGPAARFRAMVDAELGGADYYAFEPWFAALLGQLTGDAGYCAWAVERTEAWVAAEEALIAGGERAEVAFDSYLYVGDHVGNLALVYDWCWDVLEAGQRTRWLAYANQAVWNVWHPEEASWNGTSFPWSGWSIDNPSNNYYYSFLRATLLLGLAARGEHADAETWIRTFRDDKIGGQLVPTFERDLAGGGSREGTGYGVAMARLFELYDLWESSTGERIHDLTGHARNSLANFLHLVVPTLDRLAPVGDHARDSTAVLFDYHRNYVQILTYLYRSDPLAPFGKWFLEHCAVPEMDQPFMYVYDFLYDEPAVVAAPLDGLTPAYWAAGTGQLYLRSGWTTDATWVHLVAGPYTESHAHHDQGSLLLYRGEWLAWDQNIESHSGIRQEEELHNLVRLERGGATIPQREGAGPARLAALSRTAAWTYAAAELAPAYADDGVTRVDRELVFLAPDAVVVFDRIDAGADVRRIWQLGSPIRPELAGSTATFAGGTATLVLRRVLPASGTPTILDWTTDGEMGGGFRLDLADADPSGRSRFLHVLSVDGAVTGAAASPDGARLGVELTFADGTRALVRFEPDALGGTLERRDAGGAVVESAALAATVTPPPLLAE